MPGAKATSSGPRSRAAGGVPGGSALAVWQQELARRKRRFTLAGLAGVAAVLAASAAGLPGLVAALPGFGGRAGDWPVWGGPAPWRWPALAAAGALGCLVALVWPRGDPGRWARGAAGELATAELLRGLRSRRWAVFHDLALPGSRANVDHLVIGPTGVWVVDTKSYRARAEAHWRRVTFGGVPLATGPVRWEAEVVSGILGAKARPVIAVHGTGLPRRGRSYHGVRVLPAGRLLRHLRRGRFLRPSLDALRARALAEVAEAKLLPAAGPGSGRTTPAQDQPGERLRSR